MTEEEAQQLILNHETTISTLKNDLSTKETELQNKDNELTLLNTRIQELKDHNLSLFSRISTSTQQTQPEPTTPPEPKLNTIINTLLNE